MNGCGSVIPCTSTQVLHLMTSCRASEEFHAVKGIKMDSRMSNTRTYSSGY